MPFVRMLVPGAAQPCDRLLGSDLLACSQIKGYALDDNRMIMTCEFWVTSTKSWGKTR
jgi:hypothetical protein